MAGTQEGQIRGGPLVTGQFCGRHLLGIPSQQALIGDPSHQRGMVVDADGERLGLPVRLNHGSDFVRACTVGVGEAGEFLVINFVAGTYWGL